MGKFNTAYNQVIVDAEEDADGLFKFDILGKSATSRPVRRLSIATILYSLRVDVQRKESGINGSVCVWCPPESRRLICFMLS